mgnify:CR=1 FL=1
MADIRSLAQARAIYNEAEMRARCSAAGQTCKNSIAGCTCHELSAYQPVSAPDQPPLETMPGDLSEHHTDPGRSYLPLTVWTLALAATLVLFGWVLSEVAHGIRRMWP